MPVCHKTITKYDKNASDERQKDTQYHSKSPFHVTPNLCGDIRADGLRLHLMKSSILLIDGLEVWMVFLINSLLSGGYFWDCFFRDCTLQETNEFKLFDPFGCTRSSAVESVELVLTGETWDTSDLQRCAKSPCWAWCNLLRPSGRGRGL